MEVEGMNERANSDVLAYLPGMSLYDYLQHMKRAHPGVLDILDMDLLDGLGSEAWVNEANEFEDDTGNGRGASYRRAQYDDSARQTGIVRILAELADPDTGVLGTVLDVLGGDGLVARAWRRLNGSNHDTPIPIITGDISGQMVSSALRFGLPAVRQPANCLLHRSGVLDGVMLAYGTHHLSRAERADAVVEAMRVLKSGGRLALHDFETKSAASRWFQNVVAPYSRAGHDYEHFTEDEMFDYCDQAGFVDIRVCTMYDPIIVNGDSAQSALDGLAEYMSFMYGLVLVEEVEVDLLTARERVIEFMRETFCYSAGELPPDASDGVRTLTVRKREKFYQAELPRVALLATGRKE
jgi:SAM-dependent methyltransferase